MPPARSGPLRGEVVRIALFATACAVIFFCGCSTQPQAVLPRPVSAALSPAAEQVAPSDAWRLAEKFSAAHAGTEIVIGRGGSMQPLYSDRTVLVVEPRDMNTLEPGMTVVFIGDTGAPVAHTLVEKTPRGWVAAGLANAEPDRTRVRFANYLGTVVKAFAPDPLVASVTRPARAR